MVYGNAKELGRKWDEMRVDIVAVWGLGGMGFDA